VGIQTKSTTKEICQHCIKIREKRVQKKTREIISNIPKDFTIAEDESIFVHDALVRRRMWIPKGKRPIVVTTGSHQKTCVFGVLSIDGRQLFRRYDTFDRYTFILRLFEEIAKQVS
jgi:hypothetical protein